MFINISYKFHRIPDRQSRIKTKVHDLLGQPSYSAKWCNSSFTGSAGQGFTVKLKTKKIESTAGWIFSIFMNDN